MSGFQKSIIGIWIGILLSSGAALADSAVVQLKGRKYQVQIIPSESARSDVINVRFAEGAVAKIPAAVVVSYIDPTLLKDFARWGYEVQPIAGLPRTVRVNVPSANDTLKLCEKLTADKRVRYAHPDFIFEVESREADPTLEPLFKDQWNLENTSQSGGTSGADIGIEAAWKVTTGKPETIVALLDLGFEQEHEDLIGAWAINTKEIPDNKKDDDGNGLIDDVRGWNFSTNNNKLIFGQNSKHGTAVAGIVGARVNGKGIAGICPDCKILPVVVSGRVSEDAAAILYGMRMGASVMTNSWGYNMRPPETDVVSEALTKAAKEGRGGKGLPIIFAMHNKDVNDCRPQNPDISAHPSVIAVSSVDHHDVKVEESAHGKCLAFVAPSSGSTVNGIVTTDRPGKDGYNTNGTDNYTDLAYHRGFWGTSAAAPQVAAVFALLMSSEPQLTLEQAMERMKAAAVKVHPNEANYDPKTGHSLLYGFGRLHAGKLFP